MNFPAELRYTKDHEWIRVSDDGKTATVGITDFAQHELGDIVYVDIDTVDRDVSQDEVFGTIEAVKTVSELFMPVSGRVLEMNEGLDATPEAINSDPYGEGWIIRIELSDASQLEGLMDADAYTEVVGA